MKKILFILAILLINTPNVKAVAQFYTTEDSNNYYSVYLENDSKRKEPYKYINRSSDGKLMYTTSLTRWSYNMETSNFFESSYQPFYKEEITNQLKDIMYFGYGYKEFTNTKYLFATQTMVWNLLSTNSIGYISNNSNDIFLYKNEIKEITKLINAHNTKISFCNMELETQENVLVLNDNNKVLSNYQVSKSNAKIIDNSLVIDTSNSEEILLEEKLTEIPVDDVFYRGDYFNLVSKTMIEKNTCKITVKKVASKISVEENASSSNENNNQNINLTDSNSDANNLLDSEENNVIEINKEVDSLTILDDKVILENVPNTFLSSYEIEYFIDDKKKYSNYIINYI